MSLKPSAKKRELYLTDTVELLLNRGEKVAAYPLAGEKEIQGVNSQQDLSRLEEMTNLSNICALQSQGVTVIMPSQTYIQKGVKIGRGTVIHPFVWIEKGVKIGPRCQIGPFAKIRSKTKIGAEVVIGSFVEVVRSTIGSGTRMKHLSYFGDAVVGKNVNVGAGTVTANYDGKDKNTVSLKDRSFTGVNTSLVAPLKLPEGLKTGAGSVVTARKKFRKNATVAGVPARELGKKRKAR
jgi:bifunctional UDP-N-acetylglucosamine pyrophosphorylase/glucosamine-1-phosphate N-acetyltransferase